MATEVVLDDTQYQQAINFHCQRVATQHEAMAQSMVKAKSAVGSVVQITVGATMSAPLPTPEPVPTSVTIQ